MKATTTRRAVVGAVLLCPLFLAGGCYTRTVEARGVGAEYRSGKIYEPNLKLNREEGDTALDGAGDLLLGPRRIEERRR